MVILKSRGLLSGGCSMSYFFSFLVVAAWGGLVIAIVFFYLFSFSQSRLHVKGS